jgi:hypothetical protein
MRSVVQLFALSNYKIGTIVEGEFHRWIVVRIYKEKDLRLCDVAPF